MTEVVIDTNVILVANQQHDDVDEECVIACLDKLKWTKEHGIVVIDDTYRVISEYLHKTNVNGDRAGDAFIKWLLQNKSNTNSVHQVPITETAKDHFAEFPDQTLQPEFDAPDRKFPAVANAHPSKPPVVQAVDCKWLNWWPALQAGGVTVEFICPTDACRFYVKKFPANPVPALP